jgi:hypothetical protein
VYHISQAKLTAKTNLMADADYLQALNVTYAGQLVRCIGTKVRGIFRPNRTYFRNESNTGWVPDTQFVHLHNAATDDAGGLIRDVHRVNIHDIAQFAGYWPNAAMFKITKTGTSDIINQGDRVDFSVEPLNNGYINGNLQGGTIDVGQKSAWCINGFATSGSRMTVKIGIGMEQVHIAAPIDRRYGLEACDTAGSSRNYNIDTGDGTTWSLEPTSQAVQQSAPHGMLMTHEPAANVKLHRLVGGVETFNIKTSHVPVTGTVQSIKPFGIGYKTNESVAKQYKLFSLKIEGKTAVGLWPNAFD